MSSGLRVNPRFGRRVCFAWLILLLAIHTPIDAIFGNVLGSIIPEARADLPAGTVPMGTFNAEVGAHGRAIEEQEQLNSALQRLKEFRTFLVIWIIVMLVGFLFWWFRPRRTWVPHEAVKPEEPMIDVEVEEVTVADRSLPSDEERRRSRDALITLALAWEERYGLPPLQLSVIAARDAALLVGMSDERYSLHMQDRVVPAPSDVDFIFNKNKYVVRSVRRTSGGELLFIPPAPSSGWDFLIFILYDTKFAIVGAWQMTIDLYQTRCTGRERLTPENLQDGKNLLSFVQTTSD
ncbi:MAG: hypothetical protein H7834_05350 [Magnetococcus sp. YQC-9]